MQGLADGRDGGAREDVWLQGLGDVGDQAGFCHGGDGFGASFSRGLFLSYAPLERSFMVC